MPAGQPTKYEEDYNEQAKKLCIIFGADDKKLAEFFGVCKATITNWKKDQPKFLASIKRGKDIYDTEHVEACLLERALGYEHDDVQFFSHQGIVTDERIIKKHYPPEVTAAIFWLKNRHPDRWKDVKKTELTGKDGGPVETANRNLEITPDMDPKEAARRYAQVVKGER